MATAVGTDVAARQHARNSSIRQHAAGYLLVAPPLLFLALLVVYPSMKAVWDTFTSRPYDTGNGVVSVSSSFSLDTYRQLFTNPDYRLDRRAITYTLQVTATTLVALFLLCYPLAMYLRFSRSRVASFFRTLTLIPLFIPTIVSAYAFISFYQQGNFLDVLMQNTHVESVLFGGRYPQLIDNTTGIVMGQVWNNIPITVLLIGAGLAEIDNALIESARDVGAGYLRIFASILFPLTLRQSLIAFILAFIGVMGSYNLPALVGPTLPQMLGPAMNDNIAHQRLLIAQAEAVLTFGVAALVGILYVVAVARQRRR